MSALKTKWDKLQFLNTDTYTWVFDKGRMFVINEAAYEHKKDKLNKNVYEEKFINTAKERSK